MTNNHSSDARRNSEDGNEQDREDYWENKYQKNVRMLYVNDTIGMRTITNILIGSADSYFTLKSG